jgi:hypothetical protein
MATDGPLLVHLRSVTKAHALGKVLCSDTSESVGCFTAEPLFAEARYASRAQTHKLEVVMVDDGPEIDVFEKLFVRVAP